MRRSSRAAPVTAGAGAVAAGVVLVTAIAAVLAAGAAPPPAPFTLTTTSFTPGEPLPARFTCDDAGESPSLAWNDPPPGTRSMAIVAEDPDAPDGLFTHWLVWGIPAGSLAIPEGVNRHRDGLGEAPQGRNDFGGHGYGAPCPPPGKPHRYVFKVLALSAPLELPADAGRAAFDAALKKVRVLATASVTGTCRRPSH